MLFAFLLMAPLSLVFDRLDTVQRVEYYVTLVLAGGAAVLLIAPTAYHRILFRRGDKQYLITAANILTLLGLTAVGLSMAGAMTFVTDITFGRWAGAAGATALTMCAGLWAGLPLARRRMLSRAARVEAVMLPRRRPEADRASGDTKASAPV